MAIDHHRGHHLVAVLNWDLRRKSRRGGRQDGFFGAGDIAG